MQPLQIKILQDQKIFIKWEDGIEFSLPLQSLRRHCPCASCHAEKDNESPTYIPLYTFDQLKVESITTVGKYAISIFWKDGHNTGIYEYTFLRKLAEK